jgi:hypothetical protein
MSAFLALLEPQARDARCGNDEHDDEVNHEVLS